MDTRDWVQEMLTLKRYAMDEEGKVKVGGRRICKKRIVEGRKLLMKQKFSISR